MYVIYIVINCVVLSLFYIYIVIKVGLFLKKRCLFEIVVWEYLCRFRWEGRGIFFFLNLKVNLLKIG